MGHIHGTEAILTGIRPPQRSMNHHGYGYYNHIIDCIICYPIVTVKYHYTVTYALSLVIQLYDKLLGILDTIICGVDLHWHS